MTPRAVAENRYYREKGKKSIVDANLHSTPDKRHRSTRSWLRVTINPQTIDRIWQRYNLKPHLVETFKLSKDKHFFEKLEDVVGLYLNPPDTSFCCFDEESQIQALDRTRPILPLALAYRHARPMMISGMAQRHCLQL